MLIVKEADAHAVYDAIAKEIVGYSPGTLWSLPKAECIRENGTVIAAFMLATRHMWRH